MGDKGSPPKGPDWKKLFKNLKPLIAENNKLFQDAVAFGELQFTKGEEFSKAILEYGMDGAGRLGDAANNFNKMVNKQVSGLYGKADEFGTAVKDIYGRDKAITDDIIGKIRPGAEALSGAGGDALSAYREQGIPFQLDYAGKLAGWDTPDRREAAAASAVSDFSLASEAAREAAIRNLEGFGIDPGQVRTAALDSRIRAQDAVNKAVLANKARVDTEDKGVQYGKVASDVYTGMAGTGRELTGAGAQQQAGIQQLAMAPGAQYLSGMGDLAKLYGTAAQIGQAGGAAGFDMKRAAEMFGMAGLTGAAGQGNVASQYGSGVYSQGADINQGTAGMVQGGYGTAGQLNQADQAAWEAQQANSPWAQIGQLAGMAIPAALGSPWLGNAVFGAGTNVARAARGGAIPESFSPSGGAIEDDVPAFLNAGEIVLSKEEVEWMGKGPLQKQRAKMAKEMKEAGIPAPKQMASLSRPRPNRAPAMPPGARAAGGISMTR